MCYLGGQWADTGEWPRQAKPLFSPNNGWTKEELRVWYATVQDLTLKLYAESRQRRQIL
jgi:hypothetical protein